jgi:probable addiction module antidote protein
MKKVPSAVSHDVESIRELKNPKEAALYLNACVQVAFEENDADLILLALYNVAQAQGVKKTADAARLHRVSLHRMLTKGGNPEWKSLFRLLAAMHLPFRFELPKTMAT